MILQSQSNDFTLLLNTKKEAGKERNKEAGINAASWILDVYIIIDIH